MKALGGLAHKTFCLVLSPSLSTRAGTALFLFHALPLTFIISFLVKDWT